MRHVDLGIGMDKKGFFFTFIAIVILMIFIIVFAYDSDESPYTTLYSERSQVQVATAFTKDLKDVYLERVLLSTSHRALGALFNYSFITRSPIDDPDLRFQELLINGTLFGNQQALLQDQTLYNWSDKIIRLAEDSFRIKTNITFYDVRLTQTSPWLLTVSVDVFIMTNYSDIIYTVGGQVVTNISIIGKNDPLLLMYGINRTIRDYFPKEWNQTTLMAHISNKTFTDNTWAPSFLMRMQNDTRSSACCGIESLMDSSVGNINYSYVDYLFLNKTYGCHIPSPSIYRPIFNITEIWGAGGVGLYFRLDEPHLAHYGYNVNDSTVEKICS